MGMFDTVKLVCPHCEKKTTFQSKTGPCQLNEYDEKEVPISILSSLDGETIICEECGEKIRISSWLPKFGSLSTFPLP